MLKLITTLLLIAPGFSHAATDASLKAGIKDFVEKSKNSKTPADYLQAFKGRMSSQAYEYLKLRAKGHENDSLPTIKARGADGMTLEYKGQFLNFQISPGSPEAFKFNNHYLDFSECKTMDERWMKIIGAMPNSSKHSSWFQLLIPRANAEDTDRTEGMGLGVTGVGVLAATLNVWNPYGWGVMLFGASVWNFGICQDILNDTVDCLQRKAILEDLMEEHPESREALEHKRPPPSCPGGNKSLLSKEDTIETQEHFKQLVNNSNDVARSVAKCLVYRKDQSLFGGKIDVSVNKTLVANCISDSAHMAHYLCVKMYGAFDSYLVGTIPPASKPTVTSER